MVTILPYPVAKSKMAFQFSVEALYRESKHVYMWTITFKKAMSDSWSFYAFAQLMKELQNNNPLLRGLRVAERHPGESWFGEEISHGLHFHLLLNQRISKAWVERVGHKWGFGFTWVNKVSRENALYCGKYLTKDGTELQKGGRKWGAIGGFRNVKVRDIEIDSEFHRNFRKVQNTVKVLQVGIDVLHSIYLNTEKHGPIENWPAERIFYSGRARELLTPDMLGFPVKDYGRNEDGSLVVDPTRKPLKLTRVNRATQKQQMQKRAALWKETARRRLLPFRQQVAEEIAKLREQNPEPAAKDSGKNFLSESPGASPGAKLVETIVPRGTKEFWLDRIPRRWVGMTLAEEKAWNKKHLG